MADNVHKVINLKNNNYHTVHSCFTELYHRIFIDITEYIYFFLISHTQLFIFITDEFMINADITFITAKLLHVSLYTYIFRYLQNVTHKLLLLLLLLHFYHSYHMKILHKSNIYKNSYIQIVIYKLIYFFASKLSFITS